MRELNLDRLKQNISGITPVFGNYLWEAVLFCLTKMRHQSGTIMIISGNINESLKLVWSGNLDDNVERT